MWQMWWWENQWRCLVRSGQGSSRIALPWRGQPKAKRRPIRRSSAPTCPSECHSLHDYRDLHACSKLGQRWAVLVIRLSSCIEACKSVVWNKSPPRQVTFALSTRKDDLVDQRIVEAACGTGPTDGCGQYQKRPSFQYPARDDDLVQDDGVWYSCTHDLKRHIHDTSQIIRLGDLGGDIIAVGSKQEDLG